MNSLLLFFAFLLGFSINKAFPEEIFYLRNEHNGFLAYLKYEKNIDGSLIGSLTVGKVEIPLYGKESEKGLEFSLGDPAFRIILGSSKEFTLLFEKLADGPIKFEGKAVKVEGEVSVPIPEENGAFSLGLWLFSFRKGLERYDSYFYLSTSAKLLFASEIKNTNSAKRKDHWIGWIENERIFMKNIFCASCRDAGMIIEGVFHTPDTIKGEMVKYFFWGSERWDLEGIKIE